jgi:hypothetical protein
MTMLTGSAVLGLLLAAAITACSGHESPPDKTSAAAEDELRLLVIGDSIPMNSPQDCPQCEGFVEQYAKAAQAALGAKVTVTNLAEHTNLTLPRLLKELPELSDDLAKADLLVVGAAHNSFELNADAPCDAPLIGDHPDWSAVTPHVGSAPRPASQTTSTSCSRKWQRCARDNRPCSVP